MWKKWLLVVIALGLAAYAAKWGWREYRKYQNRIDISSLDLAVPIQYYSQDKDEVDQFWTGYTVRSLPFKTKQESLDYLAWRSQEYPFFPELMNLWGDHSGKVVLDYGCGPGNDLVGFLVYSNAKQIIGVDVSDSALKLASHRLSLHRDADLSRMQLIRVSDANVHIPLPDKSVDYIHCEGVLHHTDNPLAILKEFNRILKDDGQACIMVYFRDSLWMHYFVVYELRTLRKEYEHLNVEETYARTTDDSACPIARCYRPEEFLALTSAAGFQGKFLDAYFGQIELDLFRKYGQKPLQDQRLTKAQKKFFAELVTDADGYPLYHGVHPGNSGVYLLQKK